jgi:hypothetical protein
MMRDVVWKLFCLVLKGVGGKVEVMGWDAEFSEWMERREKKNRNGTQQRRLYVFA